MAGMESMERYQTYGNDMFDSIPFQPLQWVHPHIAPPTSLLCFRLNWYEVAVRCPQSNVLLKPKETTMRFGWEKTWNRVKMIGFYSTCIEIVWIVWILRGFCERKCLWWIQTRRHDTQVLSSILVWFDIKELVIDLGQVNYNGLFIFYNYTIWKNWTHCKTTNWHVALSAMKDGWAWYFIGYNYVCRSLDRKSTYRSGQ